MQATDITSRLPQNSTTYGDDDDNSSDYREFNIREVDNGFIIMYDGLEKVFLSKDKVLDFLRREL